MSLRQGSLLNSTHGSYASLPSHPAHLTHRLHVLEVAFHSSQTSRLHHYFREPRSNIRLGRFLESSQHVQVCLIQGDDCGKRGLDLLSCHVISSHIRIMAPVDELWLTLLIPIPWDAAVIGNNRQMRPGPKFISRTGKLCQWGKLFARPLLGQTASWAFLLTSSRGFFSPPSVEGESQLYEDAADGFQTADYELCRASNTVICVRRRNVRHLKRVWLGEIGCQIPTTTPTLPFHHQYMPQNTTSRSFSSPILRNKGTSMHILEAVVGSADIYIQVWSEMNDFYVIAETQHAQQHTASVTVNLLTEISPPNRQKG